MPFPKRIIEPKNLCKKALDNSVKDDFEAVINLTLVGAVRQLANLAKHADSIFAELAEQCKEIVYRTESLKNQFTNIEGIVSKINAKTVKVPVGNVDLYAKVRDHYHHQENLVTNLFVPSTRPPCVGELYNNAILNPVHILRMIDQYRYDGRSATKLFSCYSVFTEKRKQKKAVLDIETRRPAALDLTTENFEKLQSKSLSTNDHLRKRSTSATLSLSMLPTPEEQMHSISLEHPSKLVPIDTSGASFDRMASTRCSFVQAERTNSHRKKKKRVNRRNTISGIPKHVQEELDLSNPEPKKKRPGSLRNIIWHKKDHSSSPSKGTVSYSDDVFDDAERIEPVKSPWFGIKWSKKHSSFREMLWPKRDTMHSSKSAPSVAVSDIDDTQDSKDNQSHGMLLKRSKRRASLRSIIWPRKGESNSDSPTSRGNVSFSDEIIEHDENNYNGLSEEYIKHHYVRLVPAQYLNSQGRLETSTITTAEVHVPADCDSNKRLSGISRSEEKLLVTSYQNSEQVDKICEDRSSDLSGPRSRCHSESRIPISTRTTLQISKGAMLQNGSASGPRNKSKSFLPISTISHAMSMAVQMRENSKRTNGNEDRQSSSGNWSGSGSSSTRQSLDSDQNQSTNSPITTSASQTSLDKDSALSLDSSQDTDDRSQENQMSNTEGTLTDDSSKQSLSNEREAWLCGQRILQKDETSESSSQTLPQSGNSEDNPNTSTDDSSVYSVDQDGYYTSMHTDTGVRRSSSLSSKRRSAIFLPDEDDSQGGSFSTHSSTSTLVDKKSPKKTPVKNAKKIPPPPPPRIFTLSTSSDTSSLSGSKRTTLSTTSNETSLSGSDTDSSRERLQYKTSINPNTYPSLCNITPVQSDDELTPHLDSSQDTTKSDTGSLNNSPIIKLPKPMSLDLPSLSAFSALTQAENKKQASLNENYMHSLPRCLSIDKNVNKKKGFLTDYCNSWPRNASSVSYKTDKAESSTVPSHPVVNMYQEDPSKSVTSFAPPLGNKEPSTETLPTIPSANSFKGPHISVPIPGLIPNHITRPNNLPLRISPEPNPNSSFTLKPPKRYGIISENISHQTIMSPTNQIPIAIPTAAIKKNNKSVPLKYAQTITVTPIPRNKTPASPGSFRSTTSMARHLEKEHSPPNGAHVNILHSTNRTNLQSPPSSPCPKKPIFVKAKSPPVLSSSKSSLTSPISPTGPGFLTSTTQTSSTVTSPAFTSSPKLCGTPSAFNMINSLGTSSLLSPVYSNKPTSPDFNNPSMTSSISSGFGTSSTSATPTAGSPDSFYSATPTENSSGFVTPTSPSHINCGFPGPECYTSQPQQFQEIAQISNNSNGSLTPENLQCFPPNEECLPTPPLTPSKLSVSQPLVQLQNRNIKSGMSAQDLFAVIHKSKKRLSIKTEIDTTSSPSSIPIRSLSPAPRSTPETGTLTPRASTPISEMRTPFSGSARPIPYKQTSMRDFKLLLLQQKNVYRNDGDHPSAAELLKANNQRTNTMSPINGNDTYSKINVKHNLLNGHSTIPQFRGINRTKRHMMHDVISIPIMEDNDEDTNTVPSTPVSNHFNNNSSTLNNKINYQISTLNGLEERNKLRQQSYPSSPVDEHAVISILDSIKKSNCNLSDGSSPVLTKSVS